MERLFNDIYARVADIDSASQRKRRVFILIQIDRKTLK
jgi:hypothetical protein